MQSPIVIAECGNNHEGNFDIACELIYAAKESGADLVKFQAGTAEGFARTKEQIPFYKKLTLTLAEYKKLFKIGEEIGIPVFFSIWGKGFEELRKLEKYHKIPARQSTIKNIKKYNSENTFVSVPWYSSMILDFSLRSTILHTVPEYPTYNSRFYRFKSLRAMFKNVGYSDHTIGISACISAVNDFGAVAIEKHFTFPVLKKKSKFRDHIHSATPDEFKIMVEAVK